MLDKLTKRFFNKGEKEVRSIRDIVICSVYEALEDYSQWYGEQGIHLPPNFATDPSAYSEALHTMAKAFKLLYDETQGRGDLWLAKQVQKDYGIKHVPEIEQIEKEIQEGLLLFGQNFIYMTDPKKGTTPGQ